MPDPTPITSDQTARLVQALRADRIGFWSILTEVGAGSIRELSASQAVKALSMLQRRRAETSGRPMEASFTR
jgi:hypothetical protein